MRSPDAPSNAVAPGGPLSLVAEDGFRRVWLTGAMIGTIRWLEFLAIGVYVLALTGSAAQVAFMMMLRMAPLALLSAVAGALADRLGGRRLLLTVVALGIAASGVQAGLAWFDRLALWHVAIGSFLSGIIWAVEMPVRRTMLGEMAGPNRTAAAMGLDTATNNGTRMLGPGVGGLLLELVGIHGAFALGVLLYAAAGLLLFRLSTQGSLAPLGRFRLFGRILDSVRIIRNDRSIVGTLAVTVVFNVFAWPAASLVPAIGETELHLTAFPIGLLMSADGFGALVGAMLVATFVRPSQFRGAYLSGVAGFCIASAIFALSPGFGVAALAQIAVGIAAACFATMQPTIIFQSAPVEARSRIMGVLSVCIGMAVIGFLHLGLLAAWLGAQGAILVTSAEGIVALCLVMLIWPEVRPRAPLRAPTR